MNKFSKEFNGYNKEEVNTFLNDVILHLEKDLTKLKNQQEEIRLLKLELLHHQETINSLNLALEHSQEASEHIRKMATEEANSIVSNAKRNANRIVNEALIRSERIELKSMNAEKNLRILKRKMRNIIEQQLEVVEEIETLEIEE